MTGVGDGAGRPVAVAAGVGEGEGDSAPGVLIGGEKKDGAAVSAGVGVALRDGDGPTLADGARVAVKVCAITNAATGAGTV